MSQERKIPAKIVKPPAVTAPPAPASPPTPFALTGTETGRVKSLDIDATGSSVEHGYRVQIRDLSFNPHRPIMLHDGIVGPGWRYVEFAKGNNPAGVPTPPYGYLDHHNLLTFQGAMALAWTTLAQNHYRSLECRLVKYRLVVEHRVVRQGVCKVPTSIGGETMSSLRGGVVDPIIPVEEGT